MTEMTPVIDQSWVPDACTLPTVEQPLRAKEFDDLFRDATTAVHRIDAHAGQAGATTGTSSWPPGRQTCLVRETRCCSFFGFTLNATGR